MGILDVFDVKPEDKQNALNMGLLQAAFGILANNKGNLGQALGAGGMMGLQGYQQAMDRSQSELIKRMQLKKLQQEMEDADALRNFDPSPFYQTPQQQAIGAGGPTPQAAAAIPSLQPKFDQKGMLAAMMGSKSPALKQRAMEMLTKEDAPMVVPEGGLVINRSGMQVAANPRVQKKDEIERLMDMAGLQDPAMRAKFAMQMLQKQTTHAPPNVTPFYQFLPTEGGYAVGDARTGAVSPAMVNGKPVMRATDSPQLQGQIAAARDSAQAAVKRDSNMSGVSELLNKAETILTNPKVQPTQSAVGVGVDKVASVFGATPRGAAESDELKVLGGMLVSKMPRMEGPQSNYDVQNYKEMAGDVGNPMLPVKRRVAALNTIRGIIAKYDKSASMPSVGEVKDGYRFKGGNPADPGSWEKQ